MAQLNKDKLKRYNLKIVRQDNKLILVVLGEEDHQPLPTEPPKAPEPEVIRPTPKGPPVNTHQELKNRIETLARKHLTPGPADEIKKESVETLLSEIQKINVVGSITPDQLRNYESMIRTLLSRKEGTHFEFREVRQLYNFRF